MKLLLVLGTTFLLFAAVVFAVGSSLPMRHRTSSHIDVPAAREIVYTRISDPARFGEWREDISTVELLRDVDGAPGFRVEENGDVITYRIDDARPPHRFVTRIVDTDLGFGGRWTIELTPRGPHTRVSVREDGEVSSPVFRFLSKHVIGHCYTQRHYLSALSASFGGNEAVHCGDR